MDLVNGFMAEMKAGPAWVYYWVMLMGAMFMLSIPFSLKNTQARLILLATLIFAPIIMMLLYAKFGYTRILGLGHIIAWIPVLYCLIKDRKSWQVGQTLVGKWLALTVCIMLVSLVFDISDVARYVMGERG